MEQNNRNKKLTAAEYFIQMQREYIIADFRRRVYFSPRNKAYWKKIMEYKRERVEQMAQRNSLESIFSSEVKMQAMQDELFDHRNRPIWPLTEEDIVNYYSRGSAFSYGGEIWILSEILDDDSVQLHCDATNETIIVKCSSISRIL